MSNSNNVLPPKLRGVPTEKKFAPAPQNYVAGLGRAARGFTTRLDLGPARMPSYTGPGTFVPGGTDAPPAVSFGSEPNGYVAGRGRGVSGFGTGSNSGAPSQFPGMIRPTAEDGDVNPALMSDSYYDNWSGFSAGLFNSSNYEAEDKDADQQWELVEERMKTRRIKKIEKVEEKEEVTNTQKIHQEFLPLKRKLAEVTDNEWSSIPDIADYNLKRRKFVRYTAAPDTLLEQAQKEKRVLSTTVVEGVQTDLRALGQARESIVKNQLKRAEDSVLGQTTVNAKDYLSAIPSLNALDPSEIGDLERVRELMKTMTSSKPNNPGAWISRARVEEIGLKIEAARKFILKGCENCGEFDEDVWLEAVRLHQSAPKIAKSILVQAVTTLKKPSVNIWLAAADLEMTAKGKKKVIRKALEMIPNSVKLWKEAVELEDDVDDARVLLSRAVECIPQNVDLWLALARLEVYSNAKKVLNKARKQLPAEPLIWIAAAELEEAHFLQQEPPDVATARKQVHMVIKKAISDLRKYELVLNRDSWINYAKSAEDGKHFEVCRAIVKHTIGLNVEQNDRKHTWIEDARNAVNDRHIETARAIYAHALSEIPDKKGLWRRSALLEKEYGTVDSLIDVLQRAVEKCPNAEDLWLMLAKEVWVGKKDVNGARNVLEKAFAENEDSENIWLAAVKLEFESNEFERARELLKKARVQASAERVWMKSAVFERNAQNFEQELKILEQAMQDFPEFDKLWMISGQWYEREGNYDKAREIYVKGLTNCPKSIALWLCAARLELLAGSTTRARSLLEKARLKNPATPELWLASVRIEQDIAVAKSILAKGLQECPNSGILWAHSIEIELRAKQRAQSALALKACDRDPVVILAVARLFWRERNLEKTRSWIERAIALNKDLGDTWIHLYACDLGNGNLEQQENTIKQCVTADPHHGELWTKVSKNVTNHRLTVSEILQLAGRQLLNQMKENSAQFLSSNGNVSSILNNFSTYVSARED